MTSSLIDIKDIAREDTPVYLTGSNVSTSFETKILKVSDQKIKLLNSVPPEQISQFMKSDNFVIQIQMRRYEAKDVTTDGKNIIFHFSHLKIIKDSREIERVEVPTSLDYMVEILNPIDKETVIKKELMDLSSSGMAIKSPFESLLFEPGSKYGKIDLYQGDNLIASTSGESVYKKNFLAIDGKTYQQIGIKFDTQISENLTP